MPGVPKYKTNVLGQQFVNKSIYPSSFVVSSLLNAFDTSPVAKWASCGEYQVVDLGNSITDQFFATRVKTRISGGKWLALAPVFLCAYQQALTAPFGNTVQPKVTLSWNLELADGTLSPTTFTCPNTGGTVLQGNFNGARDGVLQGGQILVGDFIYASAASLPYFHWTDRTLLPWLRVAWSKSGATDVLFSTTETEFNYPSNSHHATCTSYANAQTLINASGISNYNGGNNFWSANDSDTIPTCIGFVGIPLDNQKSFIFFGTSIFDGDGSASHRQGGVDPSNNTIANYNLLGFPSVFGEMITNSVPVMNFGVGASKFSHIWSGVSADSNWSSVERISLQRGIVGSIAKFFDYCIPYDVNNDSNATFNECIYNFVGTIRSSNPGIKVYACKVPNGHVDVTGTLVPYNTNLDTRWSMYDAAVTSGLIHGVLNVREPGQNIYVDLGVQVSGITTSAGTTTTINDSGASWLKNQWINSFVTVGGFKRLITANTRNQLTTTAFGSAVGNGVAYSIEGNTSGDSLHPNDFGQRRLAANFKAAIGTFESIPYFSRTA
jgi:hypothetical protein